MQQIKVLTLGCSLCLLILLFGTGTSIAQQTRTTGTIESNRTRVDIANSRAQEEREVLQQLLREVRELRLAVQRATVNNTRFQMLIERVRIQQGHVDAIGRQLENVRSHLADMRASEPQIEIQIKDAEALLERTTDINAYADLESRIKAMKGQFARFGPEKERLQNREAALNLELQSVQFKLNELNGLLDLLMDELKAP